MASKPLPSFLFFFEDTDFQLRDSIRIEYWLKEVVGVYEASVSQIRYVFCSDDYLLSMNQSFLNHDYYTDILTFPLAENPIDADIFISVDRVIDNAKQFDVSFEEELKRVMVHGLLHLFGFEDHGEKEEQTMRTEEDKCLSLYLQAGE